MAEIKLPVLNSNDSEQNDQVHNMFVNKVGMLSSPATPNISLTKPPSPHKIMNSQSIDFSYSTRGVSETLE